MQISEEKLVNDNLASFYHWMCEAGNTYIYVHYDGNVYPCEAFKNDQPVFISHAQADNVNEICLSDIYANSVYLQQIREMLDKYQSCKTCETCLAQYLSNKNQSL